MYKRVTEVRGDGKRQREMKSIYSRGIWKSSETKTGKRLGERFKEDVGE